VRRLATASGYRWPGAGRWVSVETVGWAVAAGAWALLLVGWARGWSALADHHHLLADRGGLRADDLVAFLLAWQVMVAAMMLPTSLPMIALVARATRSQPHPRLALAVFVGAYLVVWTAFAAAALMGDAAVHAAAHALPWLGAREGVIAGAILTGAGAFQFSPLKRRCLDACRNALHFVWRYYERGLGGAWRLGVRHAAFCLGCCWALMLVMFAVGVGHLAWMVVLSGVMLVEKTSAWGRRLVPFAGVVLITHGASIVVRALALA
jgi:predicted metal-binding membrane protein